MDKPNNAHKKARHGAHVPSRKAGAKTSGSSRASMMFMGRPSRWAKESAMDNDGFGTAVFWLVAGLGLMLFHFWDSDPMVGRHQFALTHDVEYHDVVMAKEPYDCDFWAAPVGQKHCSYEPIASPHWAAGRRHVIVTWSKVAD